MDVTEGFVLRASREREGIAMNWSSRRGASAATRGRPLVRAWRAWGWSVPALLAVVAVVVAACSAGPAGTGRALRPGGQPPPCSPNPPPGRRRPKLRDRRKAPTAGGTAWRHWCPLTV